MADTSSHLILVADDELSIINLLAVHIDSMGHRSAGVRDKEQLFAKLAEERPCLLVLDLQFGLSNGIDLLGEVLAKHPGLLIVMLTGQGTIANAVNAIKQGAYDFLTKPPDWDRFHVIVRHSIEQQKLEARIAALEETVEAGNAPRSLLGDDPSMRKVRDLIQTVAPTDAPILILGESGTGKELAARELHDRSARPKDAFFAVNMAALPPTLVESTLFGHEKGAFTGADKPRIGCFEAADGGTLFLDEIGEMDLGLQAKLLRFLQERMFQRVGSNKSITVDCRVIAATNRDLPEMISRGEFREDLYYRLNVVPVQLPPLRSHPSDIPVLVARFFRRAALRYRKQLTGFTPAALAALVKHPWPGNVRELENMVERLVILAGVGPEIGLDAIPLEIRGEGASVESSEAAIESLDRFEQVERQVIVEALEKCQGHIRNTAELLGVGQATIYRKLKRLNITVGAGGRPKTVAAI